MIKVNKNSLILRYMSSIRKVVSKMWLRCKKFDASDYISTTLIVVLVITAFYYKNKSLAAEKYIHPLEKCANIEKIMREEGNEHLQYYYKNNCGGN